MVVLLCRLIGTHFEGQHFLYCNHRIKPRGVWLNSTLHGTDTSLMSVGIGSLHIEITIPFKNAPLSRALMWSKPHLWNFDNVSFLVFCVDPPVAISKTRPCLWYCWLLPNQQAVMDHPVLLPMAQTTVLHPYSCLHLLGMSRSYVKSIM